eukprot:TRINITY_DN67445_c6_g2_i2.p1 TRINITY_DN67445_c6_g2~~TRINITY_DN67445_c6_g2_i2.p1  ORF type:complete len:620 (-),score=239.69 TRINITY_DN67445_c6_g2_i2:898-2736(-)
MTTTLSLWRLLLSLAVLALPWLCMGGTPSPQGVSDVLRINIATDAGENEFVFGVLSIPLTQRYTVNRSASHPASAPHDFLHQEHASWAATSFGLTRLTCAGQVTFESHPVPFIHPHERAPTSAYLVPLDEASVKATNSTAFEMLRQLIELRPAATVDGVVSVMRFALLLTHRQRHHRMSDVPRAVPRSSTVHNVFTRHSDLCQCSLRFVEPGAQSMLPEGEYISAADTDGKSSLTGRTVRFACDPSIAADDNGSNNEASNRGDVGKRSAPFAAAAVLEPLSLDELVPGERRATRVDPANATAERTLMSALASQSARPRTSVWVGPTAVPSIVLSESAHLAFRPRSPLDAPEDEPIRCEFDPHGDVFLSEHETAMVKQVPAGIVGMVKDIVDPVTKPICDGAGSMVGGMMSFQVGGAALSGVEDQLASQIPRAMAPQVVQILVPSLAHTLEALVPPKLSRHLAKFVSYAVSKKLTETLRVQLGTSLAKMIPEYVDLEVPADVAVKVARDLGHVLTKSVAASVIPALTHVMTHSPMSDYYCYYCFHYQKYCAYCQYSPTQAYYNMYYGSYYSTYFSEYFRKYYIEKEEAKLAIEERLEMLKIEKEREYEVLYDG